MKKQSKKNESPLVEEEGTPPMKAPVNTQHQDNLFDDEELPGYPHYPSSEDIMNPGNNVEKMELNEEDFSRTGVPDPSSKNKKKIHEKKSEPTAEAQEEEEAETDESSETDVSQEDLLALGNDELNMDEGDDEQLKKRPVPVDMSGDDLDVPGSELDDDNEMIGEEDEENNSYSIGGDRHDDLEENGGKSDDEF